MRKAAKSNALAKVLPSSMPGTDFDPPWEFLIRCGPRALRDYELGALSRLANHRRDLEEVLAAMARAEADAMIANWLIKSREAARAGSRSAKELLAALTALGPEPEPPSLARELLVDVQPAKPRKDNHHVQIENKS